MQFSLYLSIVMTHIINAFHQSGIEPKVQQVLLSPPSYAPPILIHGVQCIKDNQQEDIIDGKDDKWTILTKGTKWQQGVAWRV